MSEVSNLKMQEADLRRLRKEIDAEIDQVEGVLKKAVEACNEHPADKDDIMKAIEAAGKEIDAKWSKLISSFKSIGSELDSKISDLGGKIAEAIAKIGKLAH